VSATPDISVVLATHNRERRLADLFGGLRSQTLEPSRFEVIVVDDASSDGTPALLEHELERGTLRLQVLRQPVAGGPARARNAGWRRAGSPVVAFTDDDCVPAPGWLDALLAAGAGRPDAVVQGTTLPRPDELDGLDAYAKTVRVTQATPHFETCNIAYPRALLERLGGFDESYPAPAGEDSDLGWRAVREGGTQLFAPDAVVHHAVHVRGMKAALRDAMMATHGVQAYKQNADLRAHLTQGIFYERSHPLLFQAVWAMWLARRQRSAIALALPYAMNVRARARTTNTPARSAAYTVLYDVVQVGATVRGAIRHRFPVL
jgi:glycosyltransferase involved in cell wall biosynthesis